MNPTKSLFPNAFNLNRKFQTYNLYKSYNHLVAIVKPSIYAPFNIQLLKRARLNSYSQKHNHNMTKVHQWSTDMKKQPTYQTFDDKQSLHVPKLVSSNQSSF